ncbi:MAG: CDP-alcohol phosphatidyltransferase family protein [Bacteroidetes bacterium]|nr:CDP-alcohol phosphatidyltransferase family protein [Bacteroidota bacterium]MBU1717475.1 CDP-alcohol phosphatidyltransferase family protein [Bacteroidota bacterium]
MQKKHIPNIITLLNLACGFIAIIGVLRVNLIMMFWFTMAAMVFDFLDGFLARRLNAQSETGKQLDSISDMVSFGVLPGLVMYYLISWAITRNGLPELSGLEYVAVLIPVASAWRLVRYNIRPSVSTHFQGLPTPANAYFVVTYTLAVVYTNEVNIFSHPLFVAALAFISSLALVSEIPMMSLKFENYNFCENRIRYLFLMFAVALPLVLGFTGLPIAFGLYLALSAVDHYTNPKCKV